MRPRAAVKESRQVGLRRRLLLVDHHAEDVLAEFGLDELKPEVRREGAILVDRLAADHAEREDQVGAAVEEDPRARREILDAGNRVAIDDEPSSLLAKFIDGGGGHVVPGEGRVDDPDALQAFPLRRRGAATSAGGLALEPSTSASRSCRASHSATFRTSLPVPSRAPSHFGRRTTLVARPRRGHPARVPTFFWYYSDADPQTTGWMS